MPEAIVCPLWDDNDRRFRSRRYHAWDHRCGSCGRKVAVSEAVKRRIDLQGDAPVVCEECAQTSTSDVGVTVPRWAQAPEDEACELCRFLKGQMDEARLASSAVENSSGREAAGRRLEHLHNELLHHRKAAHKAHV